MKSNLVYFGHEKIIYNLNSYNYIDILNIKKLVIKNKETGEIIEYKVEYTDNFYFDTPGNYKFIDSINNYDFKKLSDLSVISKYWIEAQKRSVIMNGNFAF